MKAFRDRSAELEAKQAEVIAISMDDRDTLAKFKSELGAKFSFVSDADGRIATAFGVRGPNDTHASRKSFVVGDGLKILNVESGMFAVDPAESVRACPLHQRKSPAPAGPSASVPDAGTP